MDSKIVIGRISRPQGIRGELKIFPLTDDLSRFLRLKSVFLEGEEAPLRVLSARVNGPDVFLYLEKVIDRNAAELLRGRTLSVPREEAEKPEGTWFICDLVGLPVRFEDGEELGILSEVLTQRGTDVFWVKKPGQKKGVLFPFLERVVRKISPETGEIVLDRAAFAEVACFED